MTLTKSKSRRPSTNQRKRAAMHHKRGSHYMRPYWPYLPIVAVVSLGLLLNSWIGGINKNVLGYATDMSVSSLLSNTNAQRTANGLGALALNSVLNQAAQAKAQDMANNDYWSHVSPSGVTPWYWMTSAGYSYQTAGENLAYGFSTSADTVTGWMNSPGHRANILNTSYKDIGFGIVNAPNYQSEGAQTIVVAMYADPYVAPAPIAKATPTPTSTSTTTQAKTTTNTATPLAEQPTATPTPTPPTAAETTPAPTSDTATPTNTKTTTAEQNQTKQTEPVQQQKVTRVQLLNATNVSWSQFAISMIASIALLLFLLRHSLAWHKVLAKGEKFILHHPVLDVAFVAIATLSYILLQTSGTIR